MQITWIEVSSYDDHDDDDDDNKFAYLHKTWYIYVYIADIIHTDRMIREHFRHNNE